ncbi:hypothetical protein L1987_09721 [Smallanthus sonchifolius]|uniref:Uncharacterized protein n=1 Tax=Smallanthus sonchifolius TaxID=185202 RepID=A0ACB9JQG7_9ASTR|nr:hypothetical protein L1987_09721 [Smallanthus sonchifolius]
MGMMSKNAFELSCNSKLLNMRMSLVYNIGLCKRHEFIWLVGNEACCGSGFLVIKYSTPSLTVNVKEALSFSTNMIDGFTIGSEVTEKKFEKIGRLLNVLVETSVTRFLEMEDLKNMHEGKSLFCISQKGTVGLAS